MKIARMSTSKWYFYIERSLIWNSKVS
uniref:Uncharacterized protein n=2 Tax=Cellia TaxID=44534 RepID=A0A182NPX9_9DIPT